MKKYLCLYNLVKVMYECKEWIYLSEKKILFVIECIFLR